MKRDSNLFSYDDGGHYNIGTLLKWFFLNTVLLAFCFGWRYAVVTALSFGVVFILSRLWYNKGKYDQVIDEHEQEGYPSMGWDRLLKNWKILAVVLIVAGIVILVLT